MRNAVTPRLAAQSPGFSRSPGISSPDVTQPHRFANDITFDYQVALSPRFLQTTSHLPKRDPAWATDHVKLAAELAWASSAEGCPWSARPLAGPVDSIASGWIERGRLLRGATAGQRSWGQLVPERRRRQRVDAGLPFWPATLPFLP